MRCTIFLLVLFLFSCNHDGNVHCKVLNNTGAAIDSLRIEPTDGAQSVAIILEVDESKWYTIDMSKAELDGTYVITYWQSPKKHLRSFGYYSNGGAFDGMWSIDIEKDTILIDNIIKTPTY